VTKSENKKNLLEFYREKYPNANEQHSKINLEKNYVLENSISLMYLSNKLASEFNNSDTLQEKDYSNKIMDIIFPIYFIDKNTESTFQSLSTEENTGLYKID
jgi:hypothetical protein